MHHLPDEGVQRPILFRDRRGVEIIQDALDESAISMQLRRDRGVGANSEEALIELRCKRGDELALPWRQRRRAPHHSLREQIEVPGALGLEGEEMHDLRDRNPRCTHVPERRRVWLGGVEVLDA
jgi:hypothetical protein